MRSPEPASNNATLAVVGRFEVEGIRRFVRENYYPYSALSAPSCVQDRNFLMNIGSKR